MKSFTLSLLSPAASFVAILLLVTSSPPNLHPERETDIPRESDALKAFDWWYDQRALPGEVIPHGAYARAANYLNTKMQRESNRAPDGSASQWTSLGPNNVGGRVLAIAVNPQSPNIVWVGSASGGLWKSTNGGTGSPAWSYVNTGMNAISISAIAIDSASPNIVYIGTGEISRYKRPLVGTSGARASYGLGILKSSDDGATWNTTGLIFGFPEITAIQKIVINPRNSKTIFAATSEGVFKSTNSGDTWFLSNSVLMAMDIVINPQDTTILYSSHGNLNSSPGAGIYVTLDAGDNWSQLSNGLPSTNFGRTPLSISPTNPSIIYAGVSDGASGNAVGVYKTTNAGNAWFQTKAIDYTGSAQAWYDNVIAVDPTNPNHVYIGGLDIHESTDGGSNFPDISGSAVHVDQHAITFDPSDATVMYFGCDGGVYKSVDGGGSYADLNHGFVTTQFYPGYSVSPTDSNVSMGGLQDNGSVKYFGSPNWLSVLGADGGWTAINSSNKNILYGEFQYLTLWRSTDGGGSFANINSGLPSGSANTNFIPPFTISFSNPNVLYAGARNVYKTTNGGSSWFPANGSGSPLNGTNIAAIGVSWTSAETVMAATGQGSLGPAPSFKIYGSTNGGAVWTDVTDSLPYRYPTDIEFDPTDSRTAYVTLSGYGSGHLFKTTDLGQSWADITSNLPDIPHQAIAVDPLAPTHLYAGTDLGVFYSSNGGTTWEDYSTGMPPAMVLDLVVSRSNNALRAATFGNGVYERKLPRTPTLALTRPAGGETWVAGSTENIVWSQQFLNTVKIEYSLNNGGSWTTIADSVPAALDVYPWYVPSIATAQGLIRVSDAGYASTNGTSFSIIVDPDVFAGWNMISLDLSVATPAKSTLFPSALSRAFSYAGIYVAHDTLQPGTGYWLKFTTPQFTPYAGDSILADTIDVGTGWNMIGALSKPAQTAAIVQMPPGIVISSYYEYHGGYLTSTNLTPKKGYWVKSNAPGKLILTSSGAVPRAGATHSPPTDGANTLTITDAAGQTQQLFFGSEPNNRSLAEFELPPLPPDGVFDVRFASQRLFDILNSTSKQKVILIKDAILPLTVHWNMIEPAQQYTLENEKHEVIRLAGEGSHIAGSASRLVLSLTAAPDALPLVFGLEQNYPNPFNPATEIRYRITDRAIVNIRVFDLLGKEVGTLVNETKDPGEHRILWDAGNLPSGLYFYRLTAGAATATRKMLLVR